jgi:hypothetical protein
MIDILNLALPYFGLIFLGFACGRYKRIPDRGLAWMDFFIVYLSLPALFYRILAKTPFEQLNNFRFILTTTLATFLVLTLSFCLRLCCASQACRGLNRGAGGGLRQHRLHGAGIGARHRWRAGCGPGGAYFLLRDAVVLLAVATDDGAGAADLSRSRPHDP